MLLFYQNCYWRLFPIRFNTVDHFFHNKDYSLFHFNLLFCNLETSTKILWTPCSTNKTRTISTFYITLRPWLFSSTARRITSRNDSIPSIYCIRVRLLWRPSSNSSNTVPKAVNRSGLTRHLRVPAVAPTVWTCIWRILWACCRQDITHRIITITCRRTRRRRQRWTRLAASSCTRTAVSTTMRVITPRRFSITMATSRVIHRLTIAMAMEQWSILIIIIWKPRRPATLASSSIPSNIVPAPFPRNCMHIRRRRWVAARRRCIINLITRRIISLFTDINLRCPARSTLMPLATTTRAGIIIVSSSSNVIAQHQSAVESSTLGIRWTMNLTIPQALTLPTSRPTNDFGRWRNEVSRP